MSKTSFSFDNLKPEPYKPRDVPGLDPAPYERAKEGITRLSVGRAAEASRRGAGRLEGQGLGDVPGIRASIAGRTNVKMQETLAPQLAGIDLQFQKDKENKRRYDEQTEQRRKEYYDAKEAARSAGTWRLIGDAIKIAMVL